MPRVPKWIGDAMESLLASKHLSVIVSSAVNLSKEIRMVSLTGDFTRTEFYPGNAVAFRVSDIDFRNYTLCSFDRENGNAEILFHLHGNGPGSSFAANLKPGDQLRMVTPRGHKMFNRSKAHHFFFGDETGLSLFSLLAREITSSGQQYTGIIEMSEENIGVTAQLGMTVHPVLKTMGNPGMNAVACLSQIKDNYPEIFNEGIFYLTGNVVSIQRFREALKEYGVLPKNIKAQAYWAQDRVGL